MRVTLTKIKSCHNNLRLNVYTGRCIQLPKVGVNFWMDTFQEGLLVTTPVLTVEQVGDKFTFTTKHSEYELDIATPV